MADALMQKQTEIHIQTQIQKWRTQILRRESDTKKRVMGFFDGLTQGSVLH